MERRMLTWSPAIFAPYLYIKLFHPTSVTSSSKSVLRVPPRAKNYSKTYNFRNIAVQNLLLSLQKACIPTSMHPSCSNHEIIRFSIVKLTILAGHDTSFASKIRPKTRYGRGPARVFHAYFVPTPTPWTFSWCKTM